MAETVGPASEMLYIATDCMGDPYRTALILGAAITAKKTPRNRDVRIALLGDAVFLMKDEITEGCLPSGRPCLKDLVTEAVGLGIPFHVWKTCIEARGSLVKDADLTAHNAVKMTSEQFADLSFAAGRIFAL